MLTRERSVEVPSGDGSDPDEQRVAELRLAALAAIGREAGPEPLREGKALLDRAMATRPSVRDDKDYIDHLLSQTAPFIREAPSEVVRHNRLLAASHVLVLLIQRGTEGQEDEMVTSCLEEFQARLASLEDIAPTNASVEARLGRIYMGLMELANALGLTSFDQYAV